MTASEPPQPAGIWKLPPLILHPFAGEGGPDRLLEGSRAQLAMHGLLPSGGCDREEMARLVASGKHQEMRMLIYIGRDLQRWAEQCLDFVRRQHKTLLSEGLNVEGLREQSFLGLLINRPPENFARKLKLWGITDPRSIFTRAAGLNCVFDEPPPLEYLGARFLNSYQRFADHFFICYQTVAQYRNLDTDRFTFDLYASDEYAALLSAGWQT